MRRIRSYVNENRKYLRAASTLDFAYFFSCMGDRLWTFSCGFFVSSIGGLTWIALGQLVDSLTKMLVLPAAGHALDHMSRIRGMHIILFLNNIAIALSAVAFYFSLTLRKDNDSHNLSTLLLVVALLVNTVSRVASEAQKAAFQKDWMVVIVQSSKNGQISTHNALTNAVDQIAAFLSPIVCGFSIGLIGMPNTCLIFMVWNIISYILEVAIVIQLYRSTPQLQNDTNREKSEGLSWRGVNYYVSAVESYFSQKAWRPAFALALLYMTILGFDNIALAYGLSQGLSPEVIGYFRSAGCVTGFLGLFVYRGLIGFGVNVIAVGFIGLVCQNLLLNLTTFSLFLPGSPSNISGYTEQFQFVEWANVAWNGITNGSMQAREESLPFDHLWTHAPSLIFFFLGITGARFGLWIADPSISEIMQETVPEQERYRVYLVQTALQELFSVLKDVVVVAFPLVETFGALVGMSIAFVFSGFLLYTTYFVTEGFPCRRIRIKSAKREVPSQLELNVVEKGIHPELEDLLSKEKGAPLHTDRTEQL